MANTQDVSRRLRRRAHAHVHATAAWAQFASSLEGTITDSTGGLVPGASVTILNERPARHRP